MKVAGNKLIAECTAYDFKVAIERGKSGHWLKSVSAFANGDGGALYFGVDNSGEIIGLDDRVHSVDYISEQIRLHLDPIPRFTLTPDTPNGKFVIEVMVEPGEQTPYYVSLDGRRIAYIRSGSDTIEAKGATLVNLILKGSHLTWDAIESNHHSDEFTFLRLKNAFEQRTRTKWDASMLVSFGLVTASGYLTNAGLLFADDCPIKQARLYCTRWDGLYKDYALNDSEYQGNLLFLLDMAKSFVKVNTAKRWYKLPDYRLNFPEYSERAVEEVCLNHLQHRDYAQLGSEFHIDIFDDRIEFYTPGGMFDGSNVQDRDVLTIPSSRRNPIISEVFSQLDYVEKRGSGFRKIKEATAILPSYREGMEPTYRSDKAFFFSILKNVNYGMTDEDFDRISDSRLEPGQWNSERQTLVPDKGLLENEKGTQKKYPENEEIPQKTKEKSPQKTGKNTPETRKKYPRKQGKIPQKTGENTPEKIPQKPVRKTAQAIIDAIIDDPQLSRAKLASMLNRSEYTIRFHLNNLQERGIIEHIGPDKGGYWKVIVKK